MGDLVLKKTTTGQITLTPQDVAGNQTVTIPASDGTLSIANTSTSGGIFFGGATSGVLYQDATKLFWDDTNKYLGIGTNNTPSNKDTVTPKFVVTGSGTSGSAQIVRHTTVGGGGGILEMSSTRGTDVNSYTILQSGDGVGTLVFSGADGNEFTPAASIQCQVDGTPGDNDMPGRLTFNTTADGGSSVTERMRIDSSGKLLVGTTSTIGYSEKLGVAGTIATTGSQFNMAPGSDFEFVQRSAYKMAFYVNSATVMATLSITGVWTNASDARHKENIEEIPYGLAEVLKLQPRKYNMIGVDKKEIGFIAQEVDPILPELVHTNTNTILNEDRLTLSYGQMSAVLVKAIQELSAKNDALEARLAALEGAN